MLQTLLSSPPLRKVQLLLVRSPLSSYLSLSYSLSPSVSLSLAFSRFRLSSRKTSLKAWTAVCHSCFLFCPSRPYLTVLLSLFFSLSTISATCHPTNPRDEFKGPGTRLVPPSLFSTHLLLSRDECVHRFFPETGSLSLSLLLPLSFSLSFSFSFFAPVLIPRNTGRIIPVYSTHQNQRRK